MHEPTPPPQIAIVGRIEIYLLADGNIRTKAQAPNFVTLLGMLERAKLQLAENDQQARSRAPAIEIPHTALQRKLNGQG